MIKRMKWLMLVCAFVMLPFLFACADKKEGSIDFPETEYLFVSEVKYIDNVFMRYPFRIRTDSSNIYIMDLHAPDYYCHVLDYSTMMHRYSFAKKGNGPGELLDAENIRLTAGQGCWVLDANHSRLSWFQTGETQEEVTLNKQLVRTLDFDLYNDSLFIVPDYKGDYRFNLLDRNGNIKEKRGKIPLRKKDKDIPEMVYAQAWRGFLDYNPDNGLLAIATQLGEVIEIYDLPGDSLVNVVYGKWGEPQFNHRASYAIPDGIMGYSDVFVGKENIYALFWGHSFKDILQNQSIEGGNQIQVFDLAGNPVKQYLLDRHITGFCIDEEKGTIIGLDVNSDQPVVEIKMN